MEKNLTTGSVGRQLIGFSLPYLLSYLLQTLYGMADLFVIGQYEGVAGTAAVAVGSQVMHMLTVMIVGLAMGTTVSIVRVIGADDRPQADAATGNTVTLFLSLSQAISVAISLAVIVRRRTMPLAKADLRPQKPVMDAILKIGVPISVKDGFIQISFIVITVIANRRLMDYIRANGLQPDGFSREITLIDYGLTNDTEKFVTEITIPVREA